MAMDTEYRVNDRTRQTASIWKDLVLISEFSEFEGPLALAIVTENTYLDLKKATAKDLKILGLESFDFQAFVLRVVSVDQSGDADESKLSDQAALGGMFSIPDDTQVYTSDAEHAYYAFTHHLTLFDINARGYVHPVALSYLTCDPNKILSRFEQFMSRFNEAARLMKKGNFSNFALDLKYRLLDLEYTKSSFENPSSDYPREQQTISPEALQQAISVTKLMIDVVEANVVQLSMEPTDNSDDDELRHDLYGTAPVTPQSLLLDTPESAHPKETDGLPETIVFGQTQRLTPPNTCKEHPKEPRDDYQPKYVDTLHPVCFSERKLRSLAQLCHEPHWQDVDAPSGMTGRKRPSLPEALVLPLVSALASGQPKTPISPDNTEKERPPTRGIGHDMYAEALRCMADITRDFGKSVATLDLIEDEMAYLHPRSAAVTIGHTFIMNMDNPRPAPKRDPATSDKQKGQLSPKDTLPTADTLQEQADSDDDDDFPIQIACSDLWNHNTNTDHLAVLRSLKDVLPHLIFTLLTGRPVVVTGTEATKGQVLAVVESLSVFVPGHSKTQHRIVPWFEDQLTDAALENVALVGTKASCLDASIHCLDISCLDLQGYHLVTSPLYLEGNWITEIVNHLPLASNGDAFLAFVNSVFVAVMLKAYIYHHMYGETSRGERLSWRETASRALDSRDKKWSVGRIMSYLRRMETHESARDSIRNSDHDPEEAKRMDAAHSAEGSLGVSVGGSGCDSARDPSDHEDNISDPSQTVPTASQNESVDGLTLNERRGRRFLKEQLMVCGDDQTIVVYFAGLTSI